MGQAAAVLMLRQALRFRYHKGKHHQTYKAYRAYRSDSLYECQGGHIVFVIQKQVLWISHRSEHTSEVRRSSLQNYSKYAAAFIVCFCKGKYGKRYEGYQSNVVGYQHRREKARDNEKTRQYADISGLFQQNISKPLEQPHAAQSRHRYHKCKKLRKHAEIAVVYVF